jgi:class 3 adenylate cyclase
MSTDRTWLASVLFLDIVDYSLIPVDQQLEVKLHFQKLTSQLLAPLDDDDSISIDTGDGMAVCYLGDPEPVYRVARTMRDAFTTLAQQDGPRYQVRLGLNLGPIKVIEDLNHERNCIGSGINDAQRIMSFAAPNQLLVSKSYFEMVTQMSQTYENELRHLGTLKDKHDQPHEVYELTAKAIPPSAQAVSADDTEVQTETTAIPPAVIERLTHEFAKLQGSAAAAKIVPMEAAHAKSLNDLVQALLGQLNDDDRYSFEQFLKYYGYGGYR